MWLALRLLWLWFRRDRQKVKESFEGKNARQCADILVRRGLVKDATRPGHGMEIVGTSVPKHPQILTQEQIQRLTQPRLNFS